MKITAAEDSMRSFLEFGCRGAENDSLVSLKSAA